MESGSIAQWTTLITVVSGALVALGGLIGSGIAWAWINRKQSRKDAIDEWKELYQAEVRSKAEQTAQFNVAMQECDREHSVKDQTVATLIAQHTSDRELIGRLQARLELCRCQANRDQVPES